jgi:hypothetical protein
MYDRLIPAITHHTANDITLWSNMMMCYRYLLSRQLNQDAVTKRMFDSEFNAQVFPQQGQLR